MNNFYLGFINRKGTSGGGSASKTIQGTKSSPLLVTNSSIIVLDPSNDEDIYVQGNGGADSLGETKVFIKQYASKADMNINALQDGYAYIKASDIELANAIDVLEE